jgi:hypothetical protein
MSQNESRVRRGRSRSNHNEEIYKMDYFTYFRNSLKYPLQVNKLLIVWKLGCELRNQNAYPLMR